MEKIIEQQNPEEGLIYKKVAPKPATFGGYSWLFLHMNFATSIVAFIFIPVAVGLGVFLAVSSPDNLVFSIIIFVCAGLIALVLGFLLLAMPVISLGKAKHVVHDKTYTAIYVDRFVFHTEYDDGDVTDFVFNLAEIQYGKEYKDRFFVKGRLNGRNSAFAISKSELDERATEKLRSVCI